LAWIGGFVFQDFDEAVETYSEEGAEDGAEPVDPVVVWERVEGDAGAEATGWVQRACTG